MFLNKLKPKPLNTWEQELQQEKKEQEKTFYKAGILHRKLREKFKKNKMERNDKAPIYNLSAEQQAELEALEKELMQKLGGQMQEPKKERNDKALIEAARAVWKQNYPEMYEDLVRSGEIEASLQTSVDQYWKALDLYLEQGMDPYEAEQTSRNENLYLQGMFDDQLEEDSDEEVSPDRSEDLEPEMTEEEKFELTDEDWQAVEVAKDVARLFLKYHVSPQQIIVLGHALLALECLPLVTPGALYSFGIIYRTGTEEENEMFYIEFNLSEDTFEICQGGSVYSKSVGGDSYSGHGYYVEAGGFRESEIDVETLLCGIKGSVIAFLKLGAEITVSDESG